MTTETQTTGQNSWAKSAGQFVVNGTRSAVLGLWWLISTSASAIWGLFVTALFGVGRGLTWVFHGVRPLRIAAFIFILIVGGALVYINTLGAWERTNDAGYATIIFGIEGIVLVALPIIFAVRGWFNTPVAILIFASGIGIASFNAKPALENILTNDEGVVDPKERIAQAEKLEQEVYGFMNPETGERMEETGLLYQVTRQEDDASRVRVENGYVTASSRVDAEAAQKREAINQKLQLAETYRSQAAASTETSQLAIVTFVVAELIRSFGLKVLVGFDPEGTGRENRKPKRRRKGWARAIRDGVWNWIWGKGDSIPSDIQEASPGTVTICENEYAALKEREENAKAGGKKAARTRRVGKKKIEAAQYYEKLASTLVEAKRARPSLVMGGMVGVKKYETTGMTVSQLDEVLRTCVQHGFMSRADYDFVTGTPAVNGVAHDDDFTPPAGDADADDASGDQPHT